MTEQERIEKTKEYERVLDECARLDMKRTALQEELNRDFVQRYYASFGVAAGDKVVLRYDKNHGNRHVGPAEEKKIVLLGYLAPDFPGRGFVFYRPINKNGQPSTRTSRIYTSYIYGIERCE